jgi:transcriptional regulator with XRE-family HTH domain
MNREKQALKDRGWTYRACHMNREKQALKDRGWTYRSAAKFLEVSYQYLSDVLNGHRVSARLSKRIREIPQADSNL